MQARLKFVNLRGFSHSTASLGGYGGLKRSKQPTLISRDGHATRAIWRPIAGVELASYARGAPFTTTTSNPAALDFNPSPQQQKRSSHRSNSPDQDNAILDESTYLDRLSTAQNLNTTTMGSRQPQASKGIRIRDQTIQPSPESGGIPDPTPEYLALASHPPFVLPQPRNILVVVDLNGTLLHRPNRHDPTRFVERPFARSFLSYCVNTFRVVIWSSARPDNVKKNVRATINARRPCQGYRDLGLWNDPVIAASHPMAANGEKWSQLNTVLVDDSIDKARSEPFNLIQIPEFIGRGGREREERFIGMVAADADGKKASPLVALLAGGIAGGVEAACTYPLEFAKTRVQLYGHEGSRNPFTVIARVVRQEGLKVYKGCSTMIMGSIAKDAVRFVMFDTIRSFFEDPVTHRLGTVQSIASGMVAGVFASTLAVTPSERIKTALIDDARTARRFRSPWHCVTVLYREQGFRGALYSGYVATTLKQIGTTGFRLGTYSAIKDWERSKGIPVGGVLTSFANGAVAGTVTTLATQPFDTVKTKVQQAKQTGTMDSIRTIMAEDGICGFWRGTVMRLGRTVLAGGILFTANEEATKALKLVLGQ
ncbi:hypothetical protein GQX73_g4204 [Xylaria multiplex]|uniref:FCP1 homology domain-containing protein n=1 Tax=Xylaria multiplex TaxID=323545 RepID=A0A7C8IUE2_9PEZI|nr:hypothetical protein GQX73_g4204 [Xylaria multiplex]